MLTSVARRRNFTGCKLVLLPYLDGKLRVEQIKPLLHGIGSSITCSRT